MIANHILVPADLEGREVDEQYKEGIARLQDFISSNEYCNNVCLICLEQIAPDAAVWTCRESCFCMLHLVCAQGWAKQQLNAGAAKANSQAANPDLYASCPSASPSHYIKSVLSVATPDTLEPGGTSLPVLQAEPVSASPISFMSSS